MKGKLYIPYIDYDPETGFTSDLNLSGEEYVNYLNKEYESDRLYFDNRHGFQYNGLNKKESFKQRKNFNFYEVDVKLFNINGEDETIDDLLFHFNKRDIFVLQVDFLNLLKNDDAYYEINTWFKESYMINSSDKINDEIKIKYLPSKDFKISFSETSNAILRDCKLLDKYDRSVYVLLVNEIIFVK